MNKRKKIIRHRIMSLSIVLLFVLNLFICNVKIYAENLHSLPKEVNTFLNDIALEWISNNNYSNNLSIGDIIEVYDMQGEIFGFCISVLEDNSDFGYLVYSINQNRIIEFCIQKGSKNLYNLILEKAEGLYIIPHDTKRLYTFDGFEYFIEVKDSTNNYILFSNYGNVENFDCSLYTAVNKFNNWSDVIKDITTYSNSSTYKLLKSANIPREVYISESYVEKYCKKYACAVLAMLEVCAQNGYFDYRTSGSHQLDASKIVPAFNFLWNVSNTTTYLTANGISYGSTNDSKIKLALIFFASYYANKSISVTTTINPNYNVFTNAVDKGKSSIFSVRIYIKSGNNYEISGHSVSVTGYAYYRSYATNGYIYFLKIADGWNDYARYIIFDTDNFVSSQATVIN